MNCTDSREQLALRLYDELDEREGAALQAHLDECAECHAYSEELGHGLGRLAASTADELPVGWAAQLHARVAEEPRSRSGRSNPVAGLAAGVGIAAGFLLGLASAGFLTPSLTNSASDRSSSNPVTLIRVREDPRHAQFKRTTPAPLALGGGNLSRLQTYLSR